MLGAPLSCADDGTGATFRAVLHRGGYACRPAPVFHSEYWLSADSTYSFALWMNVF